ncbi:MAG: tetratricopeptide repeat protein [Bacteroidales bacterium]|nr:tetratricopeptide repeat protein [Bacteroidales bacterium]
MKKRITSVFLAILFVVFSLQVFGQKGVEDGSKYGHGEDSIRCTRNYSLYYEYYQQKNYTDALPYWRIPYNECPKVSKNIYIHGINMYKNFMNSAAGNEVLIYSYLDTIMMIYDQRIKYFGQEGYVLGRKARDFLLVKKDNPDDIRQGYEALSKCIQLQKNKTENFVLALFMTSTEQLFKEEEFTNEDVIQNYAIASEIIEYKLSRQDTEDNQELKKTLDGIFARSGAATCDGLISLFEPQFKKDPNDLEVIKKSFLLLRDANCTETDFYYQICKAFFKHEPKAELAYHLALLSNDRNDFSQAGIFYKQAIELQTDAKEQARYYIELGDITYRELGNNSLARDYARKAIKADPESGHPYMLIGNIYIASKSCADDELAEKAIYWLAVDYYVKAKTIQPDLSEIANKNIASYSQHFPDNETVFFHGYKEGDVYQVGCWINEKTKVRVR